LVEQAVITTLLVLIVVLPLARKWELGVARVAAVATAFALLSSVIVRLLGINEIVTPGIAACLALGMAVVLLLYRFYRAPKRRVPERDDVILSPADGKVIYVRRSQAGTLPMANKHGRDYPVEALTRTPLEGGEAVVIGIAMSFLDVHVNRAPIGGEVTLRRHYEGEFRSLKRPEAAFENERATTVIARDGLELAVVQIASRLVRQIVSWVEVGDQVRLGQPIGMIRFGSQVDLVLPARMEVQIKVTPGHRVRAGESVLAVLDTQPPASQGGRDRLTSSRQLA
jgi:phosphatidylserine decarboxylase